VPIREKEPPGSWDIGQSSASPNRKGKEGGFLGLGVEGEAQRGRGDTQKKKN